MYVCVFHNWLDLPTKQSVAVTLNPKQEMLFVVVFQLIDFYWGGELLLYRPCEISNNMVIYIYMVIYFTFSRPSFKILPLVVSI